MLFEDGGQAKVKKLGASQEVTEELALLVTLTRCDPKYIKGAR